MTEVLRLAGIAILGAAMGAVLRAFGRKEAALVCEVACGLVLLLRVLQGVNFDDYESLQYFQRVLQSAGVIDALVKAGVAEGDTVSIYDFEFDFVF